jgi:hypothetical protein
MSSVKKACEGFNYEDEYLTKLYKRIKFTLYLAENTARILYEN